MIDKIIWFLVGVFVGGLVGTLITAVLVAMKDEDEL